MADVWVLRPEEDTPGIGTQHAFRRGAKTRRSALVFKARKPNMRFVSVFQRSASWGFWVSALAPNDIGEGREGGGGSEGGTTLCCGPAPTRRRSGHQADAHRVS